MMSTAHLPGLFVCPVCKGNLNLNNKWLVCKKCGNEYAVMNGLPRFLPPEYWSREENAAVLRKAYAAFFNVLAPIYESAIWYQLTLNLSGARGNSINSIADFIKHTLSGTTGYILDVACGPATYGRRIATETRMVYGIDLSYGMLRQGLKYLTRENNNRVLLAQATADHLPFAPNTFDGGICAGSLHLFNDPFNVLFEMSNTMKSGSPLALQTFVRDKKEAKPSIKERTGFHFFSAMELKELLDRSRFCNVVTKEVGTVLYSSSERK